MNGMKHKLTSVIHVRGSIQNGRSTAMAAMARGMRPGIEGNVLWLCPTQEWKSEHIKRFNFTDQPNLTVMVLNNQSVKTICEILSEYRVVIIDNSEHFEEHFIQKVTHAWSFDPGLMGLMFVVH